jgi:hypothetical protein
VLLGIEPPDPSTRSCPDQHLHQRPGLLGQCRLPLGRFTPSCAPLDSTGAPLCRIMERSMQQIKEFWTIRAAAAVNYVVPGVEGAARGGKGPGVCRVQGSVLLQQIVSVVSLTRASCLL